MLQVAGRKSQGRLHIKDIHNFPCEDLRTIDQLWLHYSNGKFGFSVQKEIYESLGGTTEYNEVWEKFGDRVGWRKRGMFGMFGGEWVGYSDLTFNMQAPKAHLPICGYYRWGVTGWDGIGVGWGGYIFHRLLTCRIFR